MAKRFGHLKSAAAADEQSPLKGMQAKALATGDGRIFAKEKPEVWETIVDLLKRNGGRPLEGRSDVTPPAKEESEDAGAATPKDEFSKHAWGAAFVEVRVNQRLGEIRVSRVVGRMPREKS